MCYTQSMQGGSAWVKTRLRPSPCQSIGCSRGTSHSLWNRFSEPAAVKGRCGNEGLPTLERSDEKSDGAGRYPGQVAGGNQPLRWYRGSEAFALTW